MLANTGTVFEKCLTPLFERFLIMAAHDLNIGDFLAVPNGGGVHLFKRRQITAVKIYLLIRRLHRRGRLLTAIEWTSANPSAASNLVMLAK